MPTTKILKQLKKLHISGEIRTDNATLINYSTDASVYRERPIAVFLPKNKADIIKIIEFCSNHNVPLIPRGAGTSLAGQVVGKGIVCDVSKNMNKIIELNEKEKYVWVEPGVVLDELNQYLEPHNLFFGPETSTSNRCVIGGMIGNNSCGSHSLLYGSTRDHTLEVEAILSDASVVNFNELTKQEFIAKTKGISLENKIYKNIYDILGDEHNISRIKSEFPDPEIERRNHGYAIDQLIDNQIFSDSNNKFNFCKLIAGSEGTLAFISKIKLNLVDLPPEKKILICAHFNNLEEAFQANLLALKYKPGAIELMDNTILECTKNNTQQRKNRFFIKGNPKAILIIEFARKNQQDLDQIAGTLIDEFKSNKMGFHYPIIEGEKIDKVWALRKAGLGLLSNVPGDIKSVTVIEDTAVNVHKLPEYISEFQLILEKYNLNCTYHAHIGSGELHLRPLLNLKSSDDQEKFRKIAWDIARLVKKYKGSLSGEHGDGRLRGNFIPFMVGEKNYELLKQIKNTWDPFNIFNPGKIIDTPEITNSLRVSTQPLKNIHTYFDFSKTNGIRSATEQCNGSADCRKSVLFAGTMCPSYKATQDESHVTRARANVLREFLTYSNKKNPFDYKEIYEVMDLCLSCKACKTECPSSVDIAKLKAEFLQHYYDANGIKLRTRLIANISYINQLGNIAPGIFNFFLQNRFIAPVLMNLLGFSSKRKMPALSSQTMTKQYTRIIRDIDLPSPKKTIYLFKDEFTNFNDVEIGKKTVLLLNRLGYKVIIPKHIQSGRTYISKGMLRKAKKIANKNIQYLSKIISTENPLIGIEPSAILTFRDEYPDLAIDELKTESEALAKNTFTIEEFLSSEIENGNIQQNKFTSRFEKIKIHSHCQQKAVSSSSFTVKILSFPKNYSVEEIPSGCCGMAGSFGYEKEHYNLSMKIGEQILFPAVRNSTSEIIVAAGTSCRHQIKDGTGVNAKHPVEVLYEALA